MLNHSQSEKTKENKLLNSKSGTNSNRRLMTPSIKNINLISMNPNPTFSKEKKLITSTVKFSTNLQQKENVNKFQNSSTTSNISQYPSKRKFTEIQKEKEVAKVQISEVLVELDALYDTNPEPEEFSKRFKEILDKENSVNYSRLIPISLNTKGSCLLEHSKFYIQLMRFKSFTNTDSTGLASDYRLDDFISMIDNCLMYDQDDLNLLYSFFIGMLSKYYTREEIFIRLQKKEANYMVLNGICNLEDLKEIHFKHILAKPESFLKFELESNMKLRESNLSQPNSSKKKKMTNSIRDRLEKSPVFKNLLFTGSKKALESTEVNGEIEGKHSKSSFSGIKEIPSKEDNIISESVKQVDLQEENIDGVTILEQEQVIYEVEKEATPSKKAMSQASDSKHSQRFLSANKSKVYESPRPSIASRKSEHKPSFNNSSSKLPELQVNRVEENSSRKSVSKSQKKEVQVNINIETGTNLQFDLNNIEAFADSSSNIKHNFESTSYPPITNLLDTKPDINPLTDSNPVTNTNFSIQLNNLPNYFSELNVTSFSSSFISAVSKGNLSSDAQILYQEIILRNKIDLEIEKESIQFKGHVKKQPRRKNYKVESLEKFSLVAEEKVLKGEVSKENVPNEKEKKSNISKRVTRNKSKSLIKIKIEEEEEKNAEDIDVHKTEDEEEDEASKKGNKKRTKNLKNKKKYQSDVKADKIAYVSEEEKEKEIESNIKKKKNKKEESKEEVKRGRNSSVVEIPKEKSKKEKNRRSPSISDKESENEEKPSHSKTRTKKKEKKEGRSKSTTRGKKK